MRDSKPAPPSPRPPSPPPVEATDPEVIEEVEEEAPSVNSPPKEQSRPASPIEP